ncbi:MAG: hypothetical protein HXS48_16550 [Theionarchaea archaeon]|nr:hypothetical protein [Theionarchaea archaeon]
MEPFEDLIENNETIILMRYLSRSPSRQIIRLVLESPKDLYEICKLTKKKKSTIFEILKNLEDDAVIKSRLIKVGKYGRMRKQYYIEDIQIPRITRKTMLDFLQGKEIAFKEELFEFVEIMESLENVSISFSDGIRTKLSPEFVLIEILNAGLALKEILPIFLDLRDRIGFETDYDEIRNKILEILKENKYPEEKIRRYSQMIKKDIVVRSLSNKLETRNINDLVTIAENELNVNPYEAIFIVENSMKILKSLDVNSIGYLHLVMFIYFFAQARSIPCKKPDFLQILMPEEYELFIAKKNGKTEQFERFTLPPIFEKNFSTPEQIKVLDYENGNWTRGDLVNYLLSNFELEYDEAELLSYEILDKIKYLNLHQYSRMFLDSLIKELLRSHRF